MKTRWYIICITVKWYYWTAMLLSKCQSLFVLCYFSGRVMTGDCKEVWHKMCIEQCRTEHVLCLHMVNFPDQPHCTCRELIYWSKHLEWSYDVQYSNYPGKKGFQAKKTQKVPWFLFSYHIFTALYFIIQNYESKHPLFLVQIFRHGFPMFIRLWYYSISQRIHSLMRNIEILFRREFNNG